MTGVQRIGGGDRIAQLDILRGMAILLILLMNIPYMADYALAEYFPARLSWTALDQAAWWLHQLLEGTQRGLLELLFGAGVLIMARTAMSPDGPVAVADLHYRRNLWLAAFGIAHGTVLLWAGDILLSYACAALLIFPFRVLPVRKLLIIGIAMTAALQVDNVVEYAERVELSEQVATADAHHAAGLPPTATATDTAARQAWATAEADVSPPADSAVEAQRRLGGTDWTAMMLQLWVFVQFTGVGIFWENWAEAFATMLIGMALFKTGIIQGRASARTYWLLLLCGYGVGAALRAEATLTMLRFDPAPRLGMFTQGLARLPMTLGHVGPVSLLLGMRGGAGLLGAFAATGKMPLTTYMGASAVALVAFSPMFDLWGRFGFASLAAIAFAFMALQLAGANLWLRHFATGPVEWLWKSLAYNRRQSFKRRDALIGAEATA